MLKLYVNQNLHIYIASPLVIAPKATTPYIRLCGDYREINKYIKCPADAIPYPLKKVQDAQKFLYFCDIDMTNSFHQFALDDDTSSKLSIQTIWGLVRPRFMPEGISPASMLLQRTVLSAFADFDAWMIAIFDNFLLGADNFPDLLTHLKTFFVRCKERNIILKMTKAWFGVTFFGYHIKDHRLSLSQQRKQEIQKLIMPTNQKLMQSFMGHINFFRPFIGGDGIIFSNLTAPLTSMTHKDFNWSRSFLRISCTSALLRT